jgi:hypothetical protein
VHTFYSHFFRTTWLVRRKYAIPGGKHRKRKSGRDNTAAKTAG